MKLERVRLLMAVFAALALVLLPLGSLLRNGAVISAALLSFILATLVWFAFYRCPHCHGFLGQSTKLVCPHCGERL